MNKEEDLTFGGRNLVDEVNHIYHTFDVYLLVLCVLMYAILFMSLDILGQSLYLL